MFTAKIPKSEQANIMASFWSMLRELESQADDKNRELEKHQVEGYYRQWNKIMDDNKEPYWVTRNNDLEKAALEGANL